MTTALYNEGVSHPLRIIGDVAITFAGQARARFRLQHTRDHHGEPDPLGWADVTRVSDATHTPEEAIDAAERTVSGVLVDWVEGFAQLRYRRHTAEWLRVVPFDTDDEENTKACHTFDVVMERASCSS